MKRIIVLATVFVLLATAIVPAAAAPPVQEPQPPQAPSAGSDIYLPLALLPGPMLSGRVTTDRPTMNTDGSLTEIALRDVTVTAGGRSTRTDANGLYSLAFSGGATTVTFSKAGYTFGSPVQVVAGQPTNGVNATGRRTAAAPEAPEALLIPNPGFDIVPYYWNRLSGGANGWTPQYTSGTYSSPFYSMFTGVANGGALWQLGGSISAVRSHEIFVPAAATSAVVTFRVLLRTQEALAAPPAEDGSAQAPEAAEALLEMEAMKELFKTVDIDSAEAPDVPADVQFFRLVEPVGPFNSHIVVADAMWILQNNAGWTDVTYNIPASLYGRTLKLEFGAMNDDDFRRTQAWFDDVQVEINNGAGPVTCTTTDIIINPNFNDGGGGWVAKNTVRPDLNDYSDLFAFSAPTSFLNGVDPTVANPYPGGWTTGEVYQEVLIPDDAVSAWLTVNVLPRSNQWLGWYSPGAWPYFGAMPAAYAQMWAQHNEQQYGYIADTDPIYTHAPEGIRLLFKFWGANSTTWLRRSFNLIAYRGYPTLAILFGASNDGFGGSNALYVDDVTLNVCAP